MAGTLNNENDRRSCVGQPKADAHNGENERGQKSALIQYLERIELDPELEKFYPVNSKKEDWIDQYLLRELDSPQSDLIQKCDVCIGEKHRYPGCIEFVGCLSSAFAGKVGLHKDGENKTALQETHDVTPGGCMCHAECDKSSAKNAGNRSLFLSKDKHELVNHKSDFGFQRNFQIRKSFRMGDNQQGRVINFVDKEKASSTRSHVDGNCRRYNVLHTAGQSSNPLRSRVEINIVSASKGEFQQNKVEGKEKVDELERNLTCRERNLDRSTEVNNENYHRRVIDDINGDENGITNELANSRNSQTKHLREIDRYRMPVNAIGTKRDSILSQTKDDELGFAWPARQNRINSANPLKKLPKDYDADAVDGSSNMAHIHEKDTIYNSNRRRFNAVGNDTRALQKHSSIEKSVDLNGKLNSCSKTVERIGCSVEAEKEEGRSSRRKCNESVRFPVSKGKEKPVEDSGMEGNCSSGSRAGLTAGRAEGAAVIKSTKTNLTRINGFQIENNGNKQARTKHCSEAEPEPIVDISIDECAEDGNSPERKNKWMIELVDHDRVNDNISVVLLNDSPVDGFSQKEPVSLDGGLKVKYSTNDGIQTQTESHKTINCLGERNPVLENRRPGRKSIEKARLQKCFVNGDFHQEVKDDLSSSSDGKMWRKTSSSSDSAKQASSCNEKSKFFYQGQGVQLRLNIKKPTENLSNTPKNEEASASEVNSRTKKVVSTAKAVSVKTVLKPDNIEEKAGNKSASSEKETSNDNYCDKALKNSNDHDLEKLDDELTNILSYEPPKLPVPVIGKGRVEFNLKSADDESLKMENARLSKLLLEVEQARSTTVKALLSANSILHKVNDANAELEGNLKTVSTDKKFLELELNEYKEKLRNCNNEKDIFSTAKANEFESSMQVIISSWKKEKQELLSALAKSSMRVKRVEADAEGIRVAFKRVKDQLENSNATFHKLLEHNLQASVKVEEELKNLKEEKAMLNEEIARGSGDKEKLSDLENEILELKTRLESSNDEKDELCRKIGHLEKKNKQFGVECEELQEQLDHSQEIVDKLAEKEEELKERLEKETSEKEYLQGCLDETGQILLHLRNNEKKLLDEKDELEEDLEEEMQVNESLQQSLKSTMKEHQALVNRLQDMTNIHLTVKESLDQASKKEKTLQQQINSLNKTNNILHYSLDKEKEERMDLQEMYDNLESQWKTHKHDKMLELMDLKKSLEELTETEAEARLQNERLVKENDQMRVSLEHEEEENEIMRKKLARLEEWKEANETDLERISQERDTAQNEGDDLRKRVDDLSRGLQKEKERYDTLMCTLEDTEESLDKSLKDLSGAHNRIANVEKEMVELKEQIREKTKKVRELEIRLAEETSEKDRILSRSKNLENELNKLKKIEERQRDEIETSQMQVRRLEREKACLKKSLDENKQEFETHKERCVGNFQKLREELVSVQNQLVEKDRQAMKQKENWQDAMENTATDLKMLRDFLGGDLNCNSMIQGKSLLREVLERDGGADIDRLRRAYQRAESELMRDVCDLEGMLKISKEQKNTVAIVQSPMSKIKLSEVKKLRDDMYELNNDLTAVKKKISDIMDEVLLVKQGKRQGNIDEATVQTRSDDVLRKLKELDTTIAKIESDHEYVIEKNNDIINKGIAHVSREITTNEVDSSSESAYEGEENDLLRKEFAQSQLVAENQRLKRNIEFLTKKCQEVAKQNDKETEDRTDGKMVEDKMDKNILNDDETTSEKAPPSQKYIPPTSMRYPPRYPVGTQKNDYNAVSTKRSGYQSNDSGNSERIPNQTTWSSGEKATRPSYFTAEMSLFHHDDGVAAGILRRKLQSKHYMRETKGDSTSVRSSGSFKSENTSRSRRSGSVDDDDENDEDSDLSAGELRRSKTLPRRFKSRTKFV